MTTIHHYFQISLVCWQFRHSLVKELIIVIMFLSALWMPLLTTSAQHCRSPSATRASTIVGSRSCFMRSSTGWWLCHTNVWTVVRFSISSITVSVSHSPARDISVPLSAIFAPHTTEPTYQVRAARLLQLPVRQEQSFRSFPSSLRHWSWFQALAKHLLIARAIAHYGVSVRKKIYHWHWRCRCGTNSSDECCCCCW